MEKLIKGWASEVECQGTWSRNGIVWPDKASAEAAGADLLSRWTIPTAHRAIEVDEKPNRPTWAEHVAANGLPPRSVQL